MSEPIRKRAENSTPSAGNVIVPIHSVGVLWLVLQEKRSKQCDAFVCYCYEGQDPNFAEKIVPIELEEKHDFKFCIHRRDFKEDHER